MNYELCPLSIKGELADLEVKDGQVGRQDWFDGDDFGDLGPLPVLEIVDEFLQENVLVVGEEVLSDGQNDSSLDCVFISCRYWVFQECSSGYQDRSSEAEQLHFEY